MRGVETSVREAVAGWPDETRRQAETLIVRYGDPQEATASLLRWFDNHPWKGTNLFRDGVEHDFPVPHLDFLEQGIDYRVPVERAGDLLRFEGSLVIRRTRGELWAFCSDEQVNFLAINLADEVCTGRASVEEARRQLAENVADLERGETPALARGFTFSVMRGGTADPDEPFR